MSDVFIVKKEVKHGFVATSRLISTWKFSSHAIMSLFIWKYAVDVLGMLTDCVVQ